MKGKRQAAYRWWDDNAQRFPAFYSSTDRVSRSINSDDLRETVTKAFEAGIRHGIKTTMPKKHQRKSKSHNPV